MRRPTQLLVPFLITLGPIWLLFFAKTEAIGLRLAGVIGALALSMGLILMLSMVYNLKSKIELLESRIAEITHESEID
ncbi:MAG: hypothetical protein AB8G77_02340 [Rhodothermales bacterium]